MLVLTNPEEVRRCFSQEAYNDRAPLDFTFGVMQGRFFCNERFREKKAFSSGEFSDNIDTLRSWIEIMLNV